MFFFRSPLFCFLILFLNIYSAFVFTSVLKIYQEKYIILSIALVSKAILFCLKKTYNGPKLNIKDIDIVWGKAVEILLVFHLLDKFTQFFTYPPAMQSRVDDHFLQRGVYKGGGPSRRQ